MSFIVYVLGAGIFALTTSEYMVSGLMPQLSTEFGVSYVSIGYLVTVYAGAMALGGPLLTVGLLRVPTKKALLGLVALFVMGQVLAALAPSYPIMVMARLVTGVASAAFFGVALTSCATLVDPALFARASSIVLGGLMVGTVLGLPAATFLGEWLSWRVSFFAVAAVALLVGALLMACMPASSSPGVVPSLRSELALFKNGKLWGIYATSLLLIGATFAAFTYFVPILTQVSGFSPAVVPVLLVVYGIATLAGNAIVGRLADRHTLGVLTGGLLLLTGTLVVFAVYGHNQAVAVAALVVIGLTGVSMNPALVTRGARAGRNSMLVNSVHTGCIMLGVMAGSWIGGIGIDTTLGLRGPLWVGAGLAVLALLTLLPELETRRSPVHVP